MIEIVVRYVSYVGEYIVSVIEAVAATLCLVEEANVHIIKKWMRQDIVKNSLICRASRTPPTSYP